MKARNYHLPNLYMRSVQPVRHNAIMILVSSVTTGTYQISYKKCPIHSLKNTAIIKPHVVAQLWHNILIQF